MFSAVKEHFVLPASIPTIVVALMALAALAAWAGSHWLTRRLAIQRGRWRLAMFITRTAIGCGAVGLVMLLLIHRDADGQSLMLLTTNWPLWPLALGGALGVEALLAMYGLERATLAKRSGMVLIALRVCLPLILVAMLAQPVLPRDRLDSNRRVVAVLIDNSASMRIADRQMPASDKLRLAEMLGIESAGRPYRLEQAFAALEKLRMDLSAQADWLGQIKDAAGDSSRQQLDNRRELLSRTYSQGDKVLDAQIEALGSCIAGKVKLTDPVRAGLMDVKANLARPVRDNLSEALKITSSANASNWSEQLARLTDLTRSAATALAAIDPKVGALAASLDEAYYASLNPQQLSQVEAVLRQTRLALARDVLLHQSKSEGKVQPSLLDKIGQKYALKVYQFAAGANQVDVAQWKDQPPEVALAVAAAPSATISASQATSGPEREPAAVAIDPRIMQTDLAGAVQKVLADWPSRQLAGVVVLTDGRHNAPSSAEGMAERLSQQQVPLCTILMGSSQPPCDAAVISAQGPKVVYANDRMYVDAEVKLDGLANKSVRVALLDGDKEVDFKLLEPAADSLRTHVELSDEPGGVGLHTYQVRLDSFDGEVSAANNVYPVAVSVTDEQTKLLLVDGRPRWEFRYLKNLFADRDKTVRLQYVLLEPDKIEGQAPREVIHASASAPKDQTEATALPVDEKEWMKFDVVILGDVSPQALDRAQQEMLRKFVADRGGALIVVGGRFHMPQEFTGSELESLLPVTFRAPTGGGDEMFKFALTDAGSQSVLTRLKADPQDNDKFWQSVPDINWRNADVLAAKPGSTVLVYAMPPEPPDFLQGAARTPEALRLRRDFEQARPLVVTQNVAMGQVMYLNTDRTWRLRYRVGDTYHHKFWGQVLRWATAGKLPAGTDYVKLGTDQARYSPHSGIQARAKIVQRDYTPLADTEAAVAVYNSSSNQLVLRRRMQYVPDSPGAYLANLGELPGGQYRMELEAPAARDILEQDKVDKVVAEFSVDPSPMDEWIDLSADRGLPGHLASLTSGVLVEPSQATGVLDALGQDLQVLVQPRQFVLWDSPLVLAMFATLITAEWVIRKKVGLP